MMKTIGRVFVGCGTVANGCAEAPLSEMAEIENR